MISRRLFLASAGTLVFAHQTRAQTPKVWRIGFLTPLAPRDDAKYWQAFREGLRALGYVEGQNIVIEKRLAEGRLEALPGFAEELVHLKADVIVAITTPAARAAKAATTTTPITFVLGADPIRMGLVTSLNRPGANVTGVVFTTTDITAKRLGLLHELVPKAAIIAVVVDPNTPEIELQAKEAEQAGSQRRVVGGTVGVIRVRGERWLA